MRAFLLRRLLQAIPVLLGVTALTFLLLQLAPGDVLTTLAQNPMVSAETLDSLRRRFGLDQPWYVQYLLYLRNIVLRLDFGESFARHQPVFAVLREGLGNTLVLATAAAVVTWGLAIPLGVWAAARRGRPADRVLTAVASASLAVPELLSGLLLLLFAARSGWFPIGGMHSPGWERMAWGARMLDVARHLALPALVVGLVPLAARMRQMRSSLLDVLHQEYVTAARARGLSERRVLFRHALRNALNPMITLFGFTLGALVSGSFVAEVVFAWPGLGRITVEALQSEDRYLVMGAVVMSTLVLMAGNLIAARSTCSPRSGRSSRPTPRTASIVRASTIRRSACAGSMRRGACTRARSCTRHVSRMPASGRTSTIPPRRCPCAGSCMASRTRSCPACDRISTCSVSTRGA